MVSYFQTHPLEHDGADGMIGDGSSFLVRLPALIRKASRFDRVLEQVMCAAIEHGHLVIPPGGLCPSRDDHSLIQLTRARTSRLSFRGLKMNILIKKLLVCSTLEAEIHGNW